MVDEWMISVDDHLIEPPNVWVDRLPARYRQRGPRWVSDDLGEAWLVDDTARIPVSGSVTAGAWWPPEERPGPFEPLPWSQVQPSCYDPRARAEAMNTDRVLASLMFPNLPGFAGSLFQRLPDKELALLCIQAYNDWLLDEFAPAIPGRVIGLALVPFWDGELAASEAERAIGKGARAVSFSMAPKNMGFPPIHDEHWDRLYAVMNETELPLCTHLGTGSGEDDQGQGLNLERIGRVVKALGDPAKLEELAREPGMVQVLEEFGVAGGTMRRGRPMTMVAQALAGQATLLDWLSSGNFDRFPRLKVALSENGIGWIPAVLQVADWMQEMSRNRVTNAWDPENEVQMTDEGRRLARDSIEQNARRSSVAPLPSEVFRDHVFGCFIHDPVGLRLIDYIGADNVMIETDFPHNSTWWPHSMDKARESCLALADDVRYKVLRGNAERLFDFTPAELPVMAPG
jgi:predicted TIM-barrel fold metal-dependent hydrolase